MLEHLRLAPLDEVQIRNILASRVSELDTVDKAFNWIQDNPEVKSILQWPVYLIAGSTYLVPQPSEKPALDASIEPPEIMNDVEIGASANTTLPALAGLELQDSKEESILSGIAQLSDETLNEPIVQETEVKVELSHNETAHREPEVQPRDVDLNIPLLLDRVINELLKREKEKLSSTTTCLQCDTWYSELTRKAWAGGDDANPFTWYSLKNTLQRPGLFWFLNLGILRELSKQDFYVFLNHLVRSYFAAHHLCVLAQTKEYKRCRTLIRNSTRDAGFENEVLEMAKPLTSMNIQFFVESSLQGEH